MLLFAHNYTGNDVLLDISVYIRQYFDTHCSLVFQINIKEYEYKSTLKDPDTIVVY